MFANRTITRFVCSLVILASLFFTSLGITPVYAAGIVVNTAVDEISTNGFCSLREAITNANNNAATYPDCAAGSGIDTITFTGNYTITLTTGTELPTVTSAIAINGKGATNTIIQASACNPVTLPGGCTPAAYQVFTVFGSVSNLTLDSLTVRHGRCNGCNGGGISSIADSSLTVTNSTVSGNSAGGYGGGIYSESNTVTVTNSTVSGNRAATGGGISSEYGTITVTNSTLSGNSASGGGGGIYTYGSTSSLSITNSTLSGNSAEYGGGIYNSSNASLSIWGSTLSGNGEGGQGGAVYNNGNMWISNSTLSGNNAYDYGGAIFNGSNAWIHNSSIVFNTLIEGTDLGAAGIDGNVALYNSLVAGNLRLLTSTYQDCSGTSIYLEGRNLFSTNTNCTFNPVSPGTWGLLNSLILIGPLQNNGGPTSTHALFPGSNAIDTGHNSVCAAWPVNNIDQRGVTRPQGSQCDVGAYEADFVAPNTTIDNNPSNPSNDNTPTFTFSGNDGTGSGVAAFMCQMDSGGYSACSTPFTPSALLDGSHTFYVYAVDNDGNADASPASFTWTIDTVAPTVMITSAATDPTSTSPIPVAIQFSEIVTGFIAGDISLGNGTVVNFVVVDGDTYSFDLTPNGQGLVTVDIAAGVASDLSGNGNTAATQFSRTYAEVFNLFLPLIMR